MKVGLTAKASYFYNSEASKLEQVLTGKTENMKEDTTSKYGKMLAKHSEECNTVIRYYKNKRKKADSSLLLATHESVILANHPTFEVEVYDEEALQSLMKNGISTLSDLKKFFKGLSSKVVQHE